MKKTCMCLVFAILLPAIASASTIFLGATIDPSQEVPPSSGSGSGGAAVTIDSVTFNLAVEGFFSGLSSTVVSVGIYGPAFVGETGGLFLPLSLVTQPGTSGSFSGSTTVTHAQELDFINGQFYIDIFSQNFGGAQSVTTLGFGAAVTFPHGEIRGQIVPQAPAVPEPSTFALLGVGLAGLLYRQYRRKSRRTAA